MMPQRGCTAFTDFQPLRGNSVAKFFMHKGVSVFVRVCVCVCACVYVCVYVCVCVLPSSTFVQELNQRQ